MLQAFLHHRAGWEDLAIIALALGYFGGFMLAVEIALARLLFLAAF